MWVARCGLGVVYVLVILVGFRMGWGLMGGAGSDGTSRTTQPQRGPYFIGASTAPAPSTLAVHSSALSASVSQPPTTQTPKPTNPHTR